MSHLEPVCDQALAPSRPPIVVMGMALPALFAGAGERDAIRVAEFFAAQIRNANTRRAYLRAVTDFSNFCESRGLIDLDQVQPLHVAAWVEIQLKSYSKPTVKQQLAAVRMLFDWLVVGQVVRSNAASSVRGPKHSVKRGKTPVLDAESTRQLLDSIECDTDIGRRDRALIGLMVYTFARIGAAVQMKVGDYFFQGHRACVRLHEKGGKEHEMPVHHALHDLLEAYLTQAGLKGSNGPLFQSVAGRTGNLNGNPMSQSDAWNMLQRRALAAELRTRVTNHTFRATGITEYLLAGGKVEIAQRMANHESSRTTGLYDRRPDIVALDEIERIRI
ncbi:tyrosine-type recombinase/integrase [Nevskia ramosa]|uniref:tyrosine-type recombinase/integrase n=1 Tax=Nevskia ramosa TaxID=64002 RepID=UPI0023532921|nr:tyrosine-type recombinase/integrase [Nevskia ramosa]